MKWPHRFYNSRKKSKKSVLFISYKIAPRCLMTLLTNHFPENKDSNYEQF